MNFKAQRLLFKWILLWGSFALGMEGLPYELIQKIGQFVLKDDIKSWVSSSNTEIFDAYSRFLEKGFFKPIPSYSQGFNNLLILNKSFYKAISGIIHEEKLKLWFKERVIIPYFPYEVDLLKHLIAQRSVSVVNHQREVVEIASNFFSREEFFPVMFQQELSPDSNWPRGDDWQSHGKRPLDDMRLRPRGYQDHFPNVLLCDWPFLFIIFYSKMLPYYQQADEQIKTKIESYIKRHTPFGKNAHFTFDWFWDVFIKKSLSFLELAFSEKEISIAQLIDFINCYSGLTSFINCYSELKFNDDNYNKEVWEKLSEKQKILVFYYRNALGLNLGTGYDSKVYLQDCLYLIAKWLKKEYQDENLIIVDDTLTFLLTKWSMIAIKRARAKIAKDIFLWNQSIIKVDAGVTDDMFSSIKAQELLELSSSYRDILNQNNMKSEGNNLFENQQPQIPDNQPTEQEPLPSNTSEPLPKVPKKPTNKNSNSYNRIRLLKTAAFVISVPLVCIILYKMFFYFLSQLKM